MNLGLFKEVKNICTFIFHRLRFKSFLTNFQFMVNFFFFKVPVVKLSFLQSYLIVSSLSKSLNRGPSWFYFFSFLFLFFTHPGCGVPMLKVRTG